MKSPPHPGDVLRENVLVPLGLRVTEAADRLGMSRVALSRVLNGRAGLSADLAIRLELSGISTATFWLTLQMHYDLARARKREQPVVRAFEEKAA